MNKKSKIIIFSAVGAVVIVAAIVCGIVFAPKKGVGVNKYGYSVETSDQIDFGWTTGEDPQYNDNTYFEKTDIDAAPIAQNLQKLMNLVDSQKAESENGAGTLGYSARTSVYLKYGDKKFTLTIENPNYFYFIYSQEGTDGEAASYEFYNTNEDDVNAIIAYLNTLKE